MIQEKQPFRRESGFRSLIRAGVVRARRASDRGAANPWADDPVVDMLVRAATSPATLISYPALQEVVTQFLAELTPYSAAAALFEQALPVQFDSAGLLVLPRLSGLPLMDWVGEGEPIPVVRGTTSAPGTMIPHKMGVIVPLSSELMAASSAEAIVRQALLDNVGPSLDRALFTDAAPQPERPPGLLFNIAPLAATAGTNKVDVMVEDVTNLAAALAPYGGNGRIMLIAGPRLALPLALRMKPFFPVLISNSPWMATRVVAIAAAALAVALEPPRIDAGAEVLLHMDDAPQEIVSGAGVVAVPVRSTYQTDTIGLRFILPVSWALRAPAAAFINAPAW